MKPPTRCSNLACDGWANSERRYCRRCDLAANTLFGDAKVLRGLADACEIEMAEIKAKTVKHTHLNP